MTQNKKHIRKKDFIPEIMYQEGMTLPFIEIPENQEMPDKLYIWEFKRTGEFEPGPSGEDVPICDTDIHIYFNYKKAKEILSPELLDQIRISFGLEPLNSAIEKGKQITDRVIKNANIK